MGDGIKVKHLNGGDVEAVAQIKTYLSVTVELAVVVDGTIKRLSGNGKAGGYVDKGGGGSDAMGEKPKGIVDGFNG